MTRQEKIDFILKAYEDAKIVNALDEQIDKIVDHYYNSIKEHGMPHRDTILQFYDNIINTELGYIEEDKISYEENPEPIANTHNSYRCYLWYKKALENETKEDEDGNLVFVDREFDIEEYREFFKRDREQALTQLVMD